MSHLNQIIAQKLIYYRKQRQFTQEELAEQLGVTFQAVSKWETARSAPDITLLPILADIFGCTIDELFGRTTPATVIAYALPWNNDDHYHAALFKGCELIDSGEAHRKFTFVIEAETVECLAVHGNAELHGNVHESCVVNGNLEVAGDILGECATNGNVSVEGNINGNVAPGNNASIGGKVIGDVAALNNIAIGGNVTGDCSAKNNLSADSIKGDCAAGGNITVKGDATTKSINAGSVHIGGDASIKGEAHCGILECGSISEGTIVIHE